MSDEELKKVDLVEAMSGMSLEEIDSVGIAWRHIDSVGEFFGFTDLYLNRLGYPTWKSKVGYFFIFVFAYFAVAAFVVKFCVQFSGCRPGQCQSECGRVVVGFWAVKWALIIAVLQIL